MGFLSNTGSFLSKPAVLPFVVGGGVAVGMGLTASNDPSFRQVEEEEFANGNDFRGWEARSQRYGIGAVNALAWGAGAAGATALGIGFSKSPMMRSAAVNTAKTVGYVPKQIGKWWWNRQTKLVEGTFQKYQTLHKEAEAVSKAAEVAKAAGKPVVEGIGELGAITRSFGMNRLFTIPAGIVAGATVGSLFGDPDTGAEAGALAGLVAPGLITWSRLYEDGGNRLVSWASRGAAAEGSIANKMLGGAINLPIRAGILAGVSATVFTLARMTKAPEYADQATAYRGMGGSVMYQGMQDRMQMIGARGDMVMGAHNRRHG